MTGVAYGTFITDVKDKLLALIQTTTSFDGSPGQAYTDYIKRVELGTYNPNIRIELRGDRLESTGPMVTYHYTTFELKIRYAGGYDDDVLDTMLGYVGEIVDVIETNRDLDSSYVENTEIVNIQHNVTSSSNPEGVLRESVITLEVRSYRNV